MSKQIIQIEELIYKQMPKVSAQEWLAMLKEQFSVDESYRLLLDDYLLQEQTANYYIDGHLVDSERVVYNINHSYHISRQPKPTISEEDTWEDVWVHYDAQQDLYSVKYLHYLCEDSLLIHDQLCEADMPIHGKSTQAPPETKSTSVHTPPVIKPVTPAVPKSTPTPAKTVEHEVHFKKWKKHNLDKLKDLYSKGFRAWEIAYLMNVTEEGLRYQLTHSLGYTNLFTEPYWRPRKTEQMKSVQKPAPKIKKTWDELEIGDRVQHAKYGKGSVASFRSKDGLHCILIKFDVGIVKEFGYTEAILNRFFTIISHK